ncbi:hypothetical protein [Wolbachia endosymbiont of Tetranychus urticae]|uniref:hypothetical protein n=1 Tax=Wolbachia endosymbiont of Tetranychus urticae TaxID=169184 RepID=UPI00397B4BEC
MKGNQEDNMIGSVKIYPGDVSDKEWKFLEPRVAQVVAKKAQIGTIINVIQYIMKGICQ